MPAPEVLGRNGTYLVFRKLHTRVAAYRQYLRAKAASREEETLLGAKMVGRWQSGAPLALCPDQDDPGLAADPGRNNNFGYADDLRGFKCPAGAHARRERVAVITLNRPHADNAITTALGARLTEVLETIAVRPAVRAVILTGAGRRAFSVGSDLRQRKDMTKEDWLRQRQDFDRTLYTMRQLRKPIFTAVNGIAYGGCELAQSTDFIIASDNATFGQPEAMLGLAAGGGSPALLPRLLPPGKAMQMLMTGDPISAQEAYRLGMVNELYDQDELMDGARRIAAKIASNSPTAVQAVKQAVRMGQGEPIEQAIAIMMEAHWRSAVHPDRIEGIGAFNEDREPTFADPDH
jgi:enoyl-CoA hydratase